MLFLTGSADSRSFASDWRLPAARHRFCCIVVMLNGKVTQFDVVLLKSDALTVGLRSVRRQSHVPTLQAVTCLHCKQAESRAYPVRVSTCLCLIHNFLFLKG